MESRSKYLIKNVGILTISNFASKILVFLLVPLYTSVLSTKDVGVFDLIVSTVSLLVPILSLNIVDAVMRFTMDKAKSKNEIAAIGIKYIGISSCIATLIVILCRAFHLFDSIIGLELLIVLYFVSYIMNSFLIQFSKGMERVADLGVAGVLGTAFTIITNVLFLLIFKWGLPGFLAANVLGQAIPALYLFTRIKLWNYLQSFHINGQLQKEMLLYCVPLIATTVGWWVNSASDKYVVAFMCGVGANGLLSVSYKIPQVINTLHGIFTQAWQISAIKEYDSVDSATFYGRSFLILNVLLAAACTWLIVLSKPLGRILYQRDFYAAWQYVPFLLISCVLNSASGFCGSILSAKKDSKSMAMSAIYGAIANVFMNILYVWLIGIQGATIATAISSFIIYCVRKKAVGDGIIIKGYGIVVFTWALLCVQALFEIYTPFWWCELILMAIMLIINMNTIKDLWSFVIALIKKGKR